MVSVKWPSTRFLSDEITLAFDFRGVSCESFQHDADRFGVVVDEDEVAAMAGRRFPK